MSTIIVKVAYQDIFLSECPVECYHYHHLLFKVLKLIHVHLSLSLKYSVLSHIQIMYMYMYLHTWLFASAWSTKLWLVPAKKNAHHHHHVCMTGLTTFIHKFSNNFWRDAQVFKILLSHGDSQGKENVKLVPYKKKNLYINLYNPTRSKL